MSTDDGDEAIGYGRPPKSTRFKKGQSGNPRGRRKGSTNFPTDLKHALQAPVVVQDRGKSRTVTTQKAILMRLREKALKGEPRALDRLIALAKEFLDCCRKPRERDRGERSGHDAKLAYRCNCAPADPNPFWRKYATPNQQPPRSLKSITASVAYPAWLLGRDPTRRVIVVSYSNELASELHRQFRMIVDAPWYKALFPAMRATRDAGSESPMIVINTRSVTSSAFE